MPANSRWDLIRRLRVKNKVNFASAFTLLEMNAVFGSQF